MGIFDFLSSGNEKKAARAQQAGLRRGRDAAYGFIDEGQQGYDEFAGRAMGEYDRFRPAADRGYDLYADAVTGGPEGAARAREAFTTSPGYDFTRDEALQATARAGSAAGQNDTGNVYTALQDRAANLASTEYNTWLDRVRGISDDAISFGDKAASILLGQGAQRYNTGTTKGQIGFNTEAGIGNAEAEYQKSKDNAGINLFNAVTGLLALR